MRTTIVATAFLFLACGGRTYDSVAEGCDGLVAAFDAATERCASTWGTAGDTSFGVTLAGFPGAEWRRMCRAWDEAIQASADRGATTVDVSVLGDCVGTWQEARCLDLGFLQDGVTGLCPGLLTGTRSAGQACAAPWECAPGLRCVFEGDRCPGRCEGFRPKGLDEECVPGECDAAAGLVCTSEHCRPALGAGDPCENNSACDSGLCVEGRCRASVPADGDRCGVVGESQLAWCARGDACVPGAEAAECLPLAEDGSPCEPAGCADGLHCDGDTCRPLPGEGLSCTARGLCAAGLACRDGTCILPFTKPLGQACTHGIECGSGLCLGDTCGTASDAGEEVLCRSAILGGD